MSADSDQPMPRFETNADGGLDIVVPTGARMSDVVVAMVEGPDALDRARRPETR